MGTLRILFSRLLYPTASKNAERSVLRRFSGMLSMKPLHDFLPGDRIALLYPGVGANRHVGTVTRVTPTSIFIQVDGLSKPKRFVPSGKGR